MENRRATQANVAVLPKTKMKTGKIRKSGMNHNKDGSVRNINGKVYFDFPYLDDRARENSGLPWNEKNAKAVREKLDKIIVTVKDGTFRFAEVFPKSKRREFFEELEREAHGLKLSPDQVLFKDFAWEWYNLKRNKYDSTGRTLWGYKGYLKHYLIPFFGEKSFSAKLK